MDFGAGAGGVGVMGNPGAGVDVMSWYMEIPLISRIYFTGAFLTTVACAIDIISPYSLYFSYEMVFEKKEVWRLFTSYLFFGVFSIDFLFHMYQLIRYSRLLEEGDFRGQTANYVLMLMFGVTSISCVAVLSDFSGYTQIPFLGNGMTFMMVYVWGRRHEDVKMSLLGLFRFNAPYLPWVMMGFAALIGNSILVDLIGIAVGHTYYFLHFVYPVIADIRGWPVRRIMEPPMILKWLCGDMQEEVHLHQD